jgi:hypothetical protein
MKIKFDKPRSVATQILFMRPNILEAPFPDIAVNQVGRELLTLQSMLVDTHDEDLLVVRSIKDCNPPAFSELLG